MLNLRSQPFLRYLYLPTTQLPSMSYSLLIKTIKFRTGVREIQNESDLLTCEQLNNPIFQKEKERKLEDHPTEILVVLFLQYEVRTHSGC